MRLGSSLLCTSAVLLAACGHVDRRSTPDTVAHVAAKSSSARLCTTPPGGLKISDDSVGPFPVHATFDEVAHICSAGVDSMYDAVGYQSPGVALPFGTTTLLAVVNTENGAKDPERVWLWTTEGRDVLMPDGRPVPATLGETRSRFGQLLVDENLSGVDDYDGPRARLCRYPRILLRVGPKDSARHIADSASILGVEVQGVADHIPC